MFERLRLGQQQARGCGAARRPRASPREPISPFDSIARAKPSRASSTYSGIFPKANDLFRYVG